MPVTTSSTPESSSREISEQRCSSLANKTNIFAHVRHRLLTTGFAGPTTIPELVFLSLYTRFLPRPVSLVIKGPSGSGKSFALKACFFFKQKTAYEMYSGMSERFLLYSGLNFSHR